MEPVVVRLSDSVTLIHGDCRDVSPMLSNADCLFMDPPFDEWEGVSVDRKETTVCFTNWQNRGFVEQKYGKPRCEIVWHFKDGRWVSHTLPRITHESILIYGKTGDSYVGEKNADMTPKNKGAGCVGRDKMPNRMWTPRERKAINSVVEFPRNVSGSMGCWGKPVELMDLLVRWVCPQMVADPFMGSASCGVACIRNGVPYIGVEKDADTFATALARLERELSQGLLDFGGGAAAPTHNAAGQGRREATYPEPACSQGGCQ
jgi:hypothetical protein